MPAFIDEDDLINRAQRAYAACARRERRTLGICWPIIGESGWLAEEDDDGQAIVTATYRLREEVARWRWNGKRLVAIQPAGRV
jgi:hypothetical protein